LVATNIGVHDYHVVLGGHLFLCNSALVLHIKLCMVVMFPMIVVAEELLIFTSVIPLAYISTLVSIHAANFVPLMIFASICILRFLGNTTLYAILTILRVP